MLLFVAVAAAGPDDRALIGQLDREVIACRQRVEHLTEQLSGCSVEHDLAPLYAELRSVLGDQPAAVERFDDRVTVTVPFTVLFGAGGTSLREEADPLLDLIATAIRVHPELRVTVEAYNDSTMVPSALRKTVPSVWELTALRASLVVRTLADRFSVPASALTAAGRGVQPALASGADSDGTVENRRIVFILAPGATP
jgi:chemotaxis protein MotB